MKLLEEILGSTLHDMEIFVATVEIIVGVPHKLGNSPTT